MEPKIFNVIWLVYDECNLNCFALFETRKEARIYIKESKKENIKWNEKNVYLSGPHKYMLDKYAEYPTKNTKKIDISDYYG